MEQTSLEVCGYRIQAKPPRFFPLLKRLTRMRVRGSWRMLSLVSKGEVVEYELDPRHKLAVPIFRPENCWDFEDVVTYETTLIQEMARRSRAFGEATLIDCGADIGLWLVRFCQEAGIVRYVIAIEPNTEVMPFLKRNLKALPMPAVMIGAAVSNIGGCGRLQMADADHSDHARYLVPDNNGDVAVSTVDSFNVTGNVILKIDVEGGELAVLQGAAETIRSAKRCLICLEAHSEVAKRTGRDPVELLRFLNSLRPFRFVVATDKGIEPVSLDREMFGLPRRQKTIWNVIAEAGDNG